MADETRHLDSLGDRWRAGDTTVLDQLVRHRARDQIKRGLESEYEVVREYALGGLARIGDIRDLPLLLDSMDDIYVDDVARLSVQEYGDAAIQPLIDKLQAAAPEPPPLGVIEALGEIGDERAVAPLRTLADSHPNDSARTWAREALEKIAARSAA